MANWDSIYRKRRARVTKLAACAILMLLALLVTVSLTVSKDTIEFGNGVNDGLDLGEYHQRNFYVSSDSRIIKARADSDPPGRIDKGKGRAVDAAPAQGSSQRPPPASNIGGGGSQRLQPIPAEGVAGSSRVSQNNPVGQHVSGGMTSPQGQQGASISTYQWIELIIHSWRYTVPMMVLDVAEGDKLIDELKDDGVKGMSRQKDPPQPQRMAHAISIRGPWTREVQKNHDTGPIAPLLLELHITSSSPQISAYHWKQDKPFVAQLLRGNDRFPRYVSHAEMKTVCYPAQGVMVVLGHRSMEQAKSLDELREKVARRNGNIRANTKHRTFHLEDVLPPISNAQQLVAFDWYEAKFQYNNPIILNIPMLKINYILLQSVRLSDTSQTIIKDLIKYTYQGPLPTHTHAEWFEIGDTFYEILIELPEFKYLAWFFAEFKNSNANVGSHHLGVLSAVKFFRGEGDSSDTPCLIWKVEPPSFELQQDMDVRHYRAFEVAIREGIVKKDYMKRDFRMARLERNVPSLKDDPNEPHPVPKRIVRFFEGIKSARSSGPGAGGTLTEELSKSPSPLEMGGAGYGTPEGWNEMIEDIMAQPDESGPYVIPQDLSPGGGNPSKEGSPMMIDDDEMKKIQQKGLPDSFDDGLDQTMAETEHQLGAVH